jgi:hypothetical protein
MKLKTGKLIAYALTLSTHNDSTAPNKPVDALALALFVPDSPSLLLPVA